MKKLLALTLCLLLLCGFALGEETVKTSYEAEALLMPALYLQMSVPVGMRPAYTDTAFYQVEYDLGMRFDGSNDDLSISAWMYNYLNGMTADEFAEHYASPDMGYHLEKTTLNGYDAYHVWRDAEPTSDGYLLSDECDTLDASVVYTLFFTTKTDKGVALRDEIISTLRPVSFQGPQDN